MCMYEILFMVAMCWNLYLWMLVEARLATVYSELPTAVDNGKVANGKTSPEHFNPGRIVSIKPELACFYGLISPFTISLKKLIVFIKLSTIMSSNNKLTVNGMKSGYRYSEILYQPSYACCEN